MDRNQGRLRHETNFSAQQHQAQTYSWVSSSHGDQERAADPEATAHQGPGTTGPVTAERASSISLQRSARFPRVNRLTTSREFDRVFANASRSSDRYFTVLSRLNSAETARLGLTVPRRVVKHAFARNRLKRLAREVFRLEEGLPSLDFVILVNRAAPAAETIVLRDSLQRHFRRLARRAA